jgi:TonB family protein
MIFTKSRKPSGYMKIYLLSVLLISSLISFGQSPARSDRTGGGAKTDKKGHALPEYAHFPQGADSLMRFIKNHTIYPEYEWRNNIQGNVNCQFIVSKDGRISNIRVLKSLALSADSEAIRVVSLLPGFVPTVVNGVKHRTSAIVHVPFVKPPLVFDPDHAPEFPGGQDSLMAYMKKMPFPKNPSAIIGKLVFGIVVADDGSVIYAATDKQFGPLYQKEVRKFFRTFPKLKPAVKNGGPVCSEMNITVNITSRIH